MVCSVPGCGKAELSLKSGLCPMHAWRLKHEGFVGEAEGRRRKWGEGTQRPDGYKIVSGAGGKFRAREHRVIAEKALGKPLPKGSVVHHLNGDPSDNRPCNLVVCPSTAYHWLLHKRQRLFGYNGPKSPNVKSPTEFGWWKAQ